MARGRLSDPCRVRGCPNKRSKTDLVCKTCWFELPKPLRDQIWAEYKAEPGSGAHLRACADALKILRPVQGALFV